MSWKLWWPALAVLLCCPALPAQSPATPTAAAATEKLPTYDVATVRANKSNSGNWGINTQDASLKAENIPLHMLLVNAFGIREKMIFGLPPWAEDASFDVSAKVVDPDTAALKKLTDEQRQRMMQVLLEDRFGLKWHYETRVLPVYELIVAKDGSKLTAASPSEKGGTSWDNNDVKSSASKLDALVSILSQQLERPVVDKTGLTGTYDYHLKWTPTEQATPADNGKEADNAPPIFTAIQEQLGLKLQPGKDPIKTLVVDQISQPTEN